jgi:hypothetical protein
VIHLEPMDVIKEVRGPKCFCGASKVPSRAFCIDCWKKLLPKTQKGLWLHFDKGFMPVYESARAELRSPVEVQLL